MEKLETMIAIRQKYYQNEILPKVTLVKEQHNALLIETNDCHDLLTKLPEEIPQFITVKSVGTFKLTNNHNNGRLAGKVIIVTGSAQGFGLGIAQELLKEGAYLVFADLNLEEAKKNAEAANSLYQEGTAIALACDVSKEESVEKLINDTVEFFGGIDVFISNAGILISGALEDLTIEQFELVTIVNYTAYFICAKYVSSIMKLQYKYNPLITNDIIQINSKSGLEGSNKNSAYAGSKFGGVGLTQSFAKELVEFNIKVNSICPGNYYEGPLWSNPEKGLFVQYLKAGKVPGAKTIEEVKESYILKVPMKRGCYPSDVVKAILYCIEQKYETGQAIPVTGGQNMLR